MPRPAAAPDTAPPTRAVRVDGLDLVVHEEGDSEAPAVLLLHGIGSSGASFAPVLPLIAGRHRVVAWNQPGYGGSGRWPGERPTAADYAGLVLALADAMDLGPVRLVGHSLGALIAAAAAAEAPDRVSRLVLADPAGGYGCPAEGPWPERVTGRVEALARLGPTAYARERAANLCAPDADPVAVAAVEREMARLAVPGLSAAVSILAQGRIADDLARHGRPGIVVCGAQDRITPPEGVRAIAQGWPGARYLELAGAGHAGYAEVPVAYAQAVLAEPEDVR